MTDPDGGRRKPGDEASTRGDRHRGVLPAGANATTGLAARGSIWIAYSPGAGRRARFDLVGVGKRTSRPRVRSPTRGRHRPLRALPSPPTDQFGDGTGSTSCRASRRSANVATFPTSSSISRVAWPGPAFKDPTMQLTARGEPDTVEGYGASLPMPEERCSRQCGARPIRQYAAGGQMLASVDVTTATGWAIAVAADRASLSSPALLSTGCRPTSRLRGRRHRGRDQLPSW